MNGSFRCALCTFQSMNLNMLLKIRFRGHSPCSDEGNLLLLENSQFYLQYSRETARVKSEKKKKKKKNGSGLETANDPGNVFLAYTK